MHIFLRLAFENEGEKRLTYPLVKIIWNFKISEKVKVFLWSLAYRSLINLRKKLRRKIKNWIMSPFCFLCYLEEESLDHMFLHCPFATRGCQIIFEEFGACGGKGIVGCLKISPRLWILCNQIMLGSRPHHCFFSWT